MTTARVSRERIVTVPCRQAGEGGRKAAACVQAAPAAGRSRVVWSRPPQTPLVHRGWILAPASTAWLLLVALKPPGRHAHRRVC